MMMLPNVENAAGFGVDDCGHIVVEKLVDAAEKVTTIDKGGTEKKKLTIV